MYKNNVTFEVLVNGRAITEYSKDGKSFIEGRKNNEYSLRITNNTGGRVLAIPSVDGLSVLDGELASEKSTGYVLSAYQAINIEGWRINSDEIRKFFFSSRKGSYSNKVGEGTNNLGVIGLLVYDEFPRVTWKTHTFVPRYQWDNGPSWGNTDPWYRTGNIGSSLRGVGMNASSAQAGNSEHPGVAVNYMASMDSFQPLVFEESNLGTGMGEKVTSKVTEVSFEKGNLRAAISLYYFEKKQLEKMGVINLAPKLPQAFPKGFCKEV